MDLHQDPYRQQDLLKKYSEAIFLHRKIAPVINCRSIIFERRFILAEISCSIEVYIYWSVDNSKVKIAKTV